MCCVCIEYVQVDHPSYAVPHLHLPSPQQLEEDLHSREKDRDHMKELFADLTSSLPDDHPDRQCLGESYEDIAKRWGTLADRLNEREPQLGKLAADAQTHESDYGHLCDWLGPAEETAAAMATVPSELEAVQEQLKALEVCELFSSVQCHL